MRPIGPGTRARRKRWLLAVAGSRTVYLLRGEVHGGMILAVFTCRGRPAALNGATLQRPFGRAFGQENLPGGFFRLADSAPA
jgi:hypothetical protein